MPYNAVSDACDGFDRLAQACRRDRMHGLWSMDYMRPLSLCVMYGTSNVEDFCFASANNMVKMVAYYNAEKYARQ